MAMLVIAIIMGSINTIAIIIPVMEFEYKMGFLEICFAASFLYTVLILVGYVICKLFF